MPVSKWLGSPLFVSHEVRPFGRGPITPFRELTIIMGINHLLNGMILQVGDDILPSYVGIVVIHIMYKYKDPFETSLVV